MSHIDIAPNFSSTLMGFTNGIGNVFSILAPLSVSLVVQDDVGTSRTHTSSLHDPDTYSSPVSPVSEQRR